MKTRTLALVVALCLCGCGSKTAVREHWVAPEVPAPAPSPMVVLAATGSPAQREANNAAMVELLAKAGVDARAGGEVLPPSYYDKNQDGRIDDDVDTSAIRAFLEESGFRTALVVSLEDVATRVETVRGTATEQTATVWDNAMRTWIETTVRTEEPSYTYETVSFLMRANLYDLHSGALIWQIRTTTRDPKDLDNLVRSYSKEMVDTMRQDGLIGKR